MPSWSTQELCATCAAGASPRPEHFVEVVFQPARPNRFGREARDLRLLCPHGHDLTSQVAAIRLPSDVPATLKPREIRAVLA